MDLLMALVRVSGRSVLVLMGSVPTSASWDVKTSQDWLGMVTQGWHPSTQEVDPWLDRVLGNCCQLDIVIWEEGPQMWNCPITLAYGETSRALFLLMWEGLAHGRRCCPWADDS